MGLYLLVRGRDLKLLVRDRDPDYPELPPEAQHQISRYHLVVLQGTKLLLRDHLVLIWIPHMDFLIQIQGLIVFTMVKKSVSILMVVRQIFDTTTRGMGDSTLGIGIIQRPGKILILKKDGGHGVTLIWIIVSLRNFFGAVIGPVRLHQRLLLDNSL